MQYIHEATRGVYDASVVRTEEEVMIWKTGMYKNEESAGDKEINFSLVMSWNGYDDLSFNKNSMAATSRFNRLQKIEPVACVGRAIFHGDSRKAMKSCVQTPIGIPSEEQEVLYTGQQVPFQNQLTMGVSRCLFNPRKTDLGDYVGVQLEREEQPMKDAVVIPLVNPVVMRCLLYTSDAADE